jgi:hypothetical protein
MAVLDQDCAPGEAKKRLSRIAEFRGADQHRLVDQVAPLGVGIDGRAAADQGVKEGKGLLEPEPLRPDLQDQEGAVAGGLDIESDELRLGECGVGHHVGSVHGDLFPQHRLSSAARLEERPQYAFLWVNTRNRVIRMIFRSNARLQFSM